jgi:hypothetical protein
MPELDQTIQVIAYFFFPFTVLSDSVDVTFSNFTNKKHLYVPEDEIIKI